MQLVLASSSPYRRELLDRLNLPFFIQSPDIDETPRPEETPEDTVIRLAEEKTSALSAAFPQHLIIGSDQTAVYKDKLISKPGNHRNALVQLQSFSGQTLYFLTALCVRNTLQNRISTAIVSTQVKFRTLQDHEIQRYLAYEQPYDCAGSFKAEGLGIALFEKISSDDPTAIIGLPLITLSRMLIEHNYNILDNLL